MFQWLIRFLFGKQTNIFNKKGQVEHNLDQQKWETWNKRLKENPNYNFRNHTGKKR